MHIYVCSTQVHIFRQVAHKLYDFHWNHYNPLCYTFLLFILFAPSCMGITMNKFYSLKLILRATFTHTSKVLWQIFITYAAGTLHWHNAIYGPLLKSNAIFMWLLCPSTYLDETDILHCSVSITSKLSCWSFVNFNSF